MCSDNADGLLSQAAEPSVPLCEVMCRGYRYMAVQGADLCFCGDSFGKYGPAADGACGVDGSVCAHGGAQEMSCSESVTVKIVSVQNPWNAEINDVAKYGWSSALRSWNVDSPPTPGDADTFISQSGCKHDLASDSGGEAFLDANCPVAASGEELWTPLVRKQQQEHVFEVPASSSTEHTFWFWDDAQDDHRFRSGWGADGGKFWMPAVGGLAAGQWTGLSRRGGVLVRFHGQEHSSAVAAATW